MRDHPEFKAYAALVSVCFFWGTTYLGIRMALESFPPFLLVAARFILSGSILLAFALARGLHIPRGRDLRIASITGVLILGVGNGMLVFAELLVPSGVAGLIITISPFWMVGIEAMLAGGEPLHLPAIFGMIVGLGGAALLFAPDLHSHGFNHNLLMGFLLLQVGMASWSFGSIYQRRNAGKAHPVIAGAVQQLAAGLATLPFALAVREHPVHWSARGVVRHSVPGCLWLDCGIQFVCVRARSPAGGDCLHLSVRECGGGGQSRLALLSRAVRLARDCGHGGDLRRSRHREVEYARAGAGGSAGLVSYPGSSRPVRHRRRRTT